MGYYRFIYVGPILRLKRLPELQVLEITSSYNGCPVCKNKVPVGEYCPKHGKAGISITQTVKETNTPKYKIWDKATELLWKDGCREDCLAQLQRHISDNFPQGETWVRPSKENPLRKFTFDLSDDPAILHSQYDVEAEKNWFATAYAKEIEILKQMYAVEIDWAYVIDGA